ncbi:MAG: T9SS type A sorting domain-containing protein [Bacteroidota bacterium]
MKNTLLVAVVLCGQFLYSQRLSHPLRTDISLRSERTAASTAFPDTLDVLAILVQFQTDNDSRTSGDGQFDMTVATERIIDPPPHDSAYFADHFIFTENYYSKASNGKQHIRTTVLGGVITLKKQMKEYAPVNGNLPLITMIEEAWKAADSLNPSFPFEQYDLFTLFHAGVGRDIDLRAAIGFDPTPLDLPSLYFNLNSFRNLRGATYPGVALKNSTFILPNTLVLPETEVRRIGSVGGDFVLKLGINGLLVASIGSHLGLPDLFDTKTGKSGIGRFGLMDGQSIFSFSGIAPPEPSAWEKSFLGWTVPINVYGTKTLSLPAAGLHSVGNDTIYRIPISAKEYYLAENRHRDAKQNGQTITMKWSGQIIQTTFSNDEESFSSSNIDSAYGVILDVDELDWSLPGLINANNSYKGGILLWHIDESVIEQHLSVNSVNADPDHRGVDLEEADGSQDIGQSYDFGHPASGSEDGSPIDYWFSGNIFPSYKNEFSETTNPNSLSNTFARSHVTVKNFSTQAPRMTFDVSVGSTEIQLRSVMKRTNFRAGNNEAPIALDLNGDGTLEMIYTSGDSIYALKNDLTPYLGNSTGLFYPVGGRFQPASITILSRGEPALAGVQDKTVYVVSSKDDNADGIADLLLSSTAASTFTTPPMTFSDIGNGMSYVIVGDSLGRRMEFANYNPLAWSKDSIRLLFSPVQGLSMGLPGMMYSTDTVVSTVYRQGFAGKKISAMTSRGQHENYVLFDDNSFSLFQLNTASAPVTSFTVPDPVTGSFAVYDVSGDGAVDVILGAGNSLYAFNANGTLLENFPYETMDGGSVVGSPVIAQQKSNNDIVIIFGSSAGQIYAINSKGNLLSGFPLQTGGVISSLLLWNDNLSAASTDSSLYTWKVAGLVDSSKIYWKGFLADYAHSNTMTSTTVPVAKSSELLPKKFAYNWPNPVYSGTTHIRYYLGKPATVNITIVNLAGELVQELKGTSYPGLDNEVEWDISNVRSGIYFAQITASGSGEEASQIVKIAVVK